MNTAQPTENLALGIAVFTEVLGLANSTQSPKSVAISAAILRGIVAGKDPRDALDAVLGAGTYERIAGDIWAAAMRGN